MRRKTINIHEVETDLAEPLSLVSSGTEVILTEGCTPRARIVPIASPTTPRVAGLHAGAVQTNEDFGESMPDEFWTKVK